jgi:uncharacterized membrane protein
MDLARTIKHLFAAPWAVRNAFPEAAQAAITAAISAAELHHQGEIRFAVEGALDPGALWQGQTPRERALELFSLLRVWDTEHNSGVLVYVLLADHAVEIVADRGVHAAAGEAAWQAICTQMEAAFARGAYQAGAVGGIEAIAQKLRQHFPRGTGRNELPNEPILL